MGYRHRETARPGASGSQPGSDEGTCGHCVGGITLCLLLSSCANLAECRAEEEDDYPALESLALSVMAEVPVEHLSRGSYCAVTGKTPRASVGVEVRIWDSAADGIA